MDERSETVAGLSLTLYTPFRPISNFPSSKGEEEVIIRLGEARCLCFVFVAGGEGVEVFFFLMRWIRMSLDVYVDWFR